MWLAPVQAMVLPIADRHIDYAESVRARIHAAGLRGELDDRTESVARKIRDAELRKIPYMLVVGDREQEPDEVALREHRRGDAGSVAVEAFIERLRAEVESRSKGRHAAILALVDPTVSSHTARRRLTSRHYRS